MAEAQGCHFLHGTAALFSFLHLCHQRCQVTTLRALNDHTGCASNFARASGKIVARRTAPRLIMRCDRQSDPP